MKISWTIKECLTIFDRIDKLSPPLDPMDVKWFWDDHLSLDKGNLGAYYGVLNEIRLPLGSKLIVMTQDEMLPSICHELWHAYQRKTLGLILYKILAFRLWANYTVEPPARREARRVELLLGLKGQDTGEQAGD
jgi:hypothetical protein